MADNVVQLKIITTLPIPVHKVIDGIMDIKWADILAIGHDEDGELAIFSSESNKAEMIFLMEKLKFKMLNGDFDR